MCHILGPWDTSVSKTKVLVLLELTVLQGETDDKQ